MLGSLLHSTFVVWDCRIRTIRRWLKLRRFIFIII